LFRKGGILLSGEACALESNTKVANELIDPVVKGDIANDAILIACCLRRDGSLWEETLPAVDAAASKRKAADGDGRETSDVSKVGCDVTNDRTIVEGLGGDTMGCLARL